MSNPVARSVKVAPSILSADLLNLEAQVSRVVEAGADLLHLDIMDGHFVPNLTFGPALAKALKRFGIPLDVHLMISNPEWGIETFAPYADYLVIHAEATPHLDRMLRTIKQKGCKSGVALNPSTPPETIRYVMDVVDLVLVMTVNPGWGGQSFIPGMLRKIGEVSKLVREAGRPVEIAVDGGISADNARAVVDMGATILVAGNYIFSSDDIGSAIESLRRCTLVTC